MAETTFRFIYDSVAATTATSTAGGNTDGTDGRSQARRENTTTGTPSRINSLLKQSQKSVQEGIKGGLKQLGITLSLGNLLKQSQVFTSSLNAIFQILGAAFDIMLAPLMPYFATALRRVAPKLLEIGEKIGLWMERVYLEIRDAESFGSWLGHAVASGLLRGIKDALGLGEDGGDDTGKTVPWGEEYDPDIHKKPGGVHMGLGQGLFDKIFTPTQGVTDTIEEWAHKPMWSPFGDFDIRDEAPKWMDAMGFGRPVEAPLGGIGSGKGGLFGTGFYSSDQGFWENTREVGDLIGGWGSGLIQNPFRNPWNPEDAVMQGNHRDVDKNRDKVAYFHSTGPNSGSTWDDAMGTGLS